MSDRVEGGIMVAGSGWILAGLICLAVYFYQNNAASCNCPNIPVNATPQQAHAICNCPSPTNLSLLLLVGIVATSAGIGIILFRKRIMELRERLLAKARKR